MDVREPRRLRRELNIWEAIGISVALMAPSMAANINPQGTVGLVGRAIPLTFVLATVGVLLVSWTFVRLSQRFHHSGSVYGFVGATLGPRAGVVAGWGLVGTYTFYGVVTSMAAGRIFSAVPRGDRRLAQPARLGGVRHRRHRARSGCTCSPSPRCGGVPAPSSSSRAPRYCSSSSSASIVLVRLLAGNAPGGLTVTFSPFTVESGTDASTLFLGVVFGFLSFAGFEAAATLGEEARDPRRDIPRAILGTAIFGGIFFIFITWIEVMGFGADETGLKAFASSNALVAELGTQYVGSVAGQPHQPGRLGERLRLRTRLRGGRVPARLRPLPRRRRAGPPRAGLRGPGHPRAPPPRRSSAPCSSSTSSSGCSTATRSRRHWRRSPLPA